MKWHVEYELWQIVPGGTNTSFGTFPTERDAQEHAESEARPVDGYWTVRQVLASEYRN